MCITSTARRRSLTLQVLPSHLLTTSTETASSSKVESSAAAAVTSTAGNSSRAEAEAPETRPTFSFLLPSSSAKPKKSKKSSSPTTHLLPHHDGLVVQHHYHDHSTDPVVDPTLIKHKAKGGVITPFPVKLHDMLDKIEADGLASVVSWQPHGRCFVVHKPKEFVNHVMPHYFKQTKMASFQRQLNLYGFNRLTGGLDKGGYYHEMFLRGKVSLSYDIHRMRVKGTGVRLPTNPDNEPNFYALPPVVKDPVPMDFRPPMKSADPRNAGVPPLPALPKIAAPPADASSSGLVVNMAQRRADLLRESHDHSRKIAEQAAKHQSKRKQTTSHNAPPKFKQPKAGRPAAPRAPQSQQPSRQSRIQKAGESASGDVVFFEGLPFHYLDPSALPSRTGHKEPPAPQRQQARKPQPKPASTDFPQQAPELVEVKRPTFVHSSSTVVSESDDSSGDEKADDGDDFLPSFSPSNMDWDGPLSCPTLQTYMRRSSFQSFAKDSALVETVRPLEEDIETFFQGFDMPVDLYHEQIERMEDDDDTAFGYLLEQAITE